VDLSIADAVTLAVRAFGFVSGDATLLENLLAGADRGDVPKLLAQHDFLARVLDAVIKDEATLAWFARTTDLPLEAPYEARRLLKIGGKPSLT
jgi:hypothetical protein